MTKRKRKPPTFTSEQAERLMEHEAVRVSTIAADNILRAVREKADGYYAADIDDVLLAIARINARAVVTVYKPGDGQLRKAVRR